jgi:hypothetical protein
MKKMSRISLQRVHYMPKELKPGILYVSVEFDVAGHLCACGCGNKVMTPLGPTEWTFTDTARGPSLKPSIGNWQLPCRSHYWIDGGNIGWSGAWNPEEVEGGRRAEEERRRQYYESRKPKKESVAAGIKRWLNRALSWFRR